MAKNYKSVAPKAMPRGSKITKVTSSGLIQMFPTLRAGDNITIDNSDLSSPLISATGGSGGGGDASKTYCIPDGTEDYAIPTDATTVVSLGSHNGTMSVYEAMENKKVTIINASSGDPIDISGVTNLTSIAASEQVTLYSITVDEGQTYMWVSINSGTISA